MTKDLRREKHLSWHFLRRRAEARVGEIRRWQRNSGPTFENTAFERAVALEHLRLLGITAQTEIVVRKRGKWDARYDVVALLEGGPSKGGRGKASYA